MTAVGMSQHAPSGAPLAGRSIVVTRSREQSRELAGPLEALGARVIACPVIAIVDPPEPERVTDAIARLDKYDWAVLTSTNAVERFFSHAAFAGDPAGSIAAAAVRTAAVGRATAERMESFGVEPDLIPGEYRAEGLAAAFLEMGVGEGVRVLVPRALEAREVLRDTLEPLGVTVDVVPVYRTVPATPDRRVMAELESGGIDAVTFTSPSTVRNFLALLVAAGLDAADVMRNVVCASIGPITTAALAESGFDAGIEADPSTVPALVEAIAESLGGGGADA